MSSNDDKTNKIINKTINFKKPEYIHLNNKNINIKVKNIKKPLLLFDIDGTLYNDITYNYGMHWKNALEKLFQLLNKSFSLDQYMSYNKKYGLAFKGYFVENIVTYSDYLKFLEFLPFNIFKENSELLNYLTSLENSKWCFTNACHIHSKNILTKLGIENVFEYIFVCDYSNHIPVHKPMIEAYKFIENVAGTNEILFFDDVKENIKTAKKLGWNAYHIHSNKNIIEVVEDALLQYNKKY